jgi:hypothetical protein
MCNSGGGEIKHLGVAKNLNQHMSKTSALVIVSRWISLTSFKESDQRAHSGGKEDQRKDCEPVGEGGCGNLERRHGR